jgi:hypothetical protein
MRGMARSNTLDLDVISEYTGLLTGRGITESWHGDSAIAPMLAGLAAAAGPPSVFTSNPITGEVFNSRTIPSSSNHRQYNNRLNPFGAATTTSTNQTLNPFDLPQPSVLERRFNSSMQSTNSAAAAASLSTDFAEPILVVPKVSTHKKSHTGHN